MVGWEEVEVEEGHCAVRADRTREPVTWDQTTTTDHSLAFYLYLFFSFPFLLRHYPSVTATGGRKQHTDQQTLWTPAMRHISAGPAATTHHLAMRHAIVNGRVAYLSRDVESAAVSRAGGQRLSEWLQQLLVARPLQAWSVCCAAESYGRTRLKGHLIFPYKNEAIWV